MTQPRPEAVLRLDFGYFIRPVSETGTGAPRVEPVLGYLVCCGDSFGVFDTGIAGGHEDLDAHYRPARRSLGEALAVHGARVEDIAWVANSHLHFDHCGGNPLLTDRPVFVQATELATARGRADYTLPELVDDRIGYETITGAVEIAPGVHLVSTPGHVDGHQSLVVELPFATVVCAGRSHDTASLFTQDVLARQALADGSTAALPPPREWLKTPLACDPARVTFAHDLAVWERTAAAIWPGDATSRREHHADR